MQLTAAFSMLSVISIHTLAFSWHRHDSPKSSPDLEFPSPSMLRDLAIPGLLLTPRKPGHLFSFFAEIGLNKDAIGSLNSGPGSRLC
jgi:hypothetical protein